MVSFGRISWGQLAPNDAKRKPPGRQKMIFGTKKRPAKKKKKEEGKRERKTLTDPSTVDHRVEELTKEALRKGKVKTGKRGSLEKTNIIKRCWLLTLWTLFLARWRPDWAGPATWLDWA